MSKIIIGENIVKSFGEGKEKRNVLDHVSVAVEAGEFVSIMGPSGSGKSTLMYVLSGMDCSDSGKTFFDGRELSNLKEEELASIRRNHMGFVFQQASMLKNLNIIDNIMLPQVRSNRKDVKSIKTKAKKLMKQVGIEELETREVNKVSGGQLQRAGICRALMSSPKVIFGDEPTGALNSKASDEIMDIFNEVNQDGTTIILVTHDVKVASKSERVMFMSDGKIVSELSLSKYKGDDLESRISKVSLKMREIGI